MAKELVLDVVARKSSKDLVLLTQEFEALSKEIDGANKSAQQNVTLSKFLDDQIASTKKQVEQLTQEVNRTGNADLFGQLRGARRNLDVLTRYRKQLGDVGEAEKETRKELEGSDKVLRQLSNEYQSLGADVRRVEQDYKNLTDRIKVQTETVRNLQKESRAGGAIPFNVAYYRQASRALDDLKAQGQDLKQVLDAAPQDASKRFESFDDFVRARISSQHSLVKSLEQDLAKTGNFGVFGDLKKAEADFKHLESLGKDLGIAIEDGAQEGVKFLGQAFGSLPPEAQVGIAAGVAGAVALGGPVIGATLSGVLLAGIGAAGIGVAVATQLKNPLVAGAFSTLKTQLQLDLTQATSSFAPALIDGARKFGAAFDRIEPVLENGFDALAVPAEKLFDGIGKFTENAAPGFTKALEGAGVIIEEIAADLPALGRDFGEMFALLGEGAPGGADAIGKIIKAIGILAIATGAEIDLLAGMFTALEIGADLAAGKLSEAATKMAELGGGFHDGANSANALNKQIGLTGPTVNAAADAFARLNGELSTLLGRQLSVAQSNDAFQKGLNDLAQSLDKSSRSIVGNSDAAIQNRDAILALIQQAQQARDAQIQMAGGSNASKAAIDQANASYEAAIDKIEAVGTKAGISKKDLDNLAGDYRVNVIASVAIAQISSAVGTALNNLGHRAGGGSVTAGAAYVVGEKRPELFVPSTNGYILPKVPTAAPAGGTTVTFAGDTSSAFATAFMQLVRTGVVQIR